MSTEKHDLESNPAGRFRDTKRDATQTNSPLFNWLMGCGGSRWRRCDASSAAAWHTASPLAASCSPSAANSSRHSCDDIAAIASL
jgi:hypothetical protein